MVNGVPASGKSGVAAQLSAATGWPVLALDTVKDPFLAEIGAVDRPFNRVLGRASYRAVFALIAATRRGTTAIVDAWFGFQPRALLEELLAASGIDEVAGGLVPRAPRTWWPTATARGRRAGCRVIRGPNTPRSCGRSPPVPNRCVSGRCWRSTPERASMPTRSGLSSRPAGAKGLLPRLQPRQVGRRVGIATVRGQTVPFRRRHRILETPAPISNMPP